MASVIYPKWKEAVIQGASNSSLAGTVKAQLVDGNDYTYSAAHEFLSDIPSGARVGTAQTLGSKTYTSGVFDAADVTFPTVTGDQSELIAIYIDTGVEATSRLVALIDTATGLPVTPGGGDISVAWANTGNRILAI